ncbi:MAG TPA: accessory regulator AgrB, partial [Clostridiales bacterium]|nr:accessory regulator AgrB [Clostridiales bacterium]
MEKLAHNLSEKIAEKLGYDQDKKEVIAYGLTAIFQMVGIFSIASF